MKYILDTNALLQNPELVNKYDIVITSHVLREIEELELKKHSDKQLMYEIRRAKRYLKSNEQHYSIDLKDYTFTLNNDFDGQYVDNILLQVAIDNGYGIITNDVLLQEKAKVYKIPLVHENKSLNNDEYTGISEFVLDLNKEEDKVFLSSLYLNSFNNDELNLVENQYVIVWDFNKPHVDVKGNVNGYECIDTFKFQNNTLTKIKFKNIKNNYLGTIKPLNIKQRLAFDLLQNEDITVKALFGTFGAGKDFLMISHAVQLIKEGKFDKIVWVRNNVEVKDSNPIGFLPNSMEDKLKPFIMPLADHLGGEYGLQEFIDKGMVEIQHLGFIRGRDIKNSIIYVTECQSNTKEHVQLLLGRVGEGSQIWFNGDLKQVDADKFESNNGVNALKKLKGEQLYGQVILDKTERSETARLAEMLD